MKLKTMRALDRAMGVPLCWLAGISRNIFRRNVTKTPDEWRTILIVKFFGLGSILLSTPLLTVMREQFPKTRILFLTFASNQKLLEKLPQVSRTLTISTSSLRAFVVETIAVCIQLRKEPVDAVFDLEFFSKFSTFISFLSGAVVRVGFDLPARWRQRLLTHPVSLSRQEHVTEVFLSQLKQFITSVPVIPPLTRPHISMVDRVSMQRLLGINGNGEQVICVNINAGPTSLERRWGPERFTRVIQEFRRTRSPVRFFLIGNKDEWQYVEDAIAFLPNRNADVVNCAGKLSIGELIALLERSSLLITNDSGPMHLAAAVGTPVVALFGPESPEFYGPTGTGRVVYKSIGCSPCLNVYNAKLFKCPYDAQCMKSISPEEVIEAIQSVPHLSSELGLSSR